MSIVSISIIIDNSSNDDDDDETTTTTTNHNNNKKKKHSGCGCVELSQIPKFRHFKARVSDTGSTAPPHFKMPSF